MTRAPFLKKCLPKRRQPWNSLHRRCTLCCSASLRCAHCLSLTRRPSECLTINEQGCVGTSCETGTSVVFEAFSVFKPGMHGFVEGLKNGVDVCDGDGDGDGDDEGAIRCFSKSDFHREYNRGLESANVNETGNENEDIYGNNLQNNNPYSPYNQPSPHRGIVPNLNLDEVGDSICRQKPNTDSVSVDCVEALSDTPEVKTPSPTPPLSSFPLKEAKSPPSLPLSPLLPVPPESPKTTPNSDTLSWRKNEALTIGNRDDSESNM